MPMKLDLKLMAIIGLDRVKAEGKCLSNVIDEILSIGLGVTFVNPERVCTGSIINGSVLKTPDILAVSMEGQELHINLHTVARNLFLVSLEVVHRALPGTSRKLVDAMTQKHITNPTGWYFHAEIAFQ